MENVLEIKNVTKRYGNSVALDNVSLTLNKGKIIGLLGPNGSGKTTLLKLIAGLLTQNSGEIKISGNIVGEETKKLVSFLPERTYLNSDTTVNECINFFSTFYSDFDVNRVVEILNSLGVDRTRYLKTLSKGTKEKVQLALVMSRNADLYLLDEPIGGVDPAAREFVLNTIINTRKDATIVISTHLIRDIEEILDEYVFLSGNKFTDYGSVKALHEKGVTVDQLFREKYRCF